MKRGREEGARIEGNRKGLRKEGLYKKKMKMKKKRKKKRVRRDASKSKREKDEGRANRGDGV